jgi:hypothetical protein
LSATADVRIAVVLSEALLLSLSVLLLLPLLLLLGVRSGVKPFGRVIRGPVSPGTSCGHKVTSSGEIQHFKVSTVIAIV